MEKQEILWRSVKDDGMPSEEEISRTKNRFLCLVETWYLNNTSEKTKRLEIAWVENGDFIGTLKAKINYSCADSFITRVTHWAEIPMMD